VGDYRRSRAHRIRAWGRAHDHAGPRAPACRSAMLRALWLMAWSNRVNVLIHTPTSMGYRVLVGLAVGAFVFVVIPLLIRVAGPSVDAQVTTTPTPGGNMTTPTPPISPVNITGGDNVVSIGQIGGITARTVINQAVKPELRIVSRQGVDNPDGSHTEVIKTEVAAPFAPGLLIIQIQANGLKAVSIMPPPTNGVSTMNKRNVRLGSNFYTAEIPSPRGQYDIAVTTERAGDIKLDAAF
jgi:hypothetical protein